MTDDDLITALCVRIGMIMEDICGDAVTVRPGDRGHHASTVRRLQQASQRIEALTRAAAALLDTD